MTYYQDQWGSVVGRTYVGAPYQRGSSIGSFLGGVFCFVLPLLKRSVNAVGKEALRAGFNIATDVGKKNTHFKEAFKTRMRESSANLQTKAKEKLDKFMHGEGYKVSRAALPSHLVAALRKKKSKNSRDAQFVKKSSDRRKKTNEPPH